ncbi:type II toxin-antitoxin system antitoxin CcdA [Pectobacterium parmentieri]|uniref:Post-segregation antitoxin CcdA n=1 Tax=Pectobacterium parmentieri TaxID=1905730 RepID=A0A0H3HXY3_PECPM|nr:type II toxin-antitoxin system antitoxin CcdA [Pectobacterium parmentieri]AFI88741.1 Post-segregation antitoxin CcdA [Pectobacterium parmentieri]MBI0472592.1 type II toxin-antitoxin system antitoxin CcdA [Pectobacterium parmentieri]MBI0495271.1 type II toxin-antitoxin system antitoxin CcdA [Pectobacterium parmentieri]MBI0556565.1 type II toxin-antitoxin system antitoxin CcdA [Pectobacterium parmentieri]MBI0569736.1 type II toxin-antitoxin system antitoxin CcdA [Pectobacterium parmentieri]
MKHQISIAVDKDDYQILSAAGVNISDLVNDAIGREARRIKAEEWKKENREGMEGIARLIAQNGSFADENRNG